MLTFLHTVISKNRMGSLRMLCCWEEARRYKKCGPHDGQLWHSSYKIIYVLWAQIRIERLFLQLVMEKLTSLDNFPPLNYHKTSNPLFLFLPLKFQRNFPPSWFTSLYKGEERLYEYYNKFGIYEAIPCTLLRTMRKQLQ